MGTRETAIAGQAARETGTTSAATATVHRPPTYLCEAAGDEPALYCFQGNYLAGRHRPEIAVPIAALRVRAAHRDYEKAEPHAEEWLLIEWPRGETEPTKYWMSTLPVNTSLKA